MPITFKLTAEPFVRDLSKKDPRYVEVFNNINQGVGIEAANRLKERLSSILSPANKRFNVGASGKSSQNFRIETLSEDTGRISIAIMEDYDVNSGANYFIQYGINRIGRAIQFNKRPFLRKYLKKVPDQRIGNIQHKDYRGEKKDAPNKMLYGIRQWAIVKGIPLKWSPKSRTEVGVRYTSPKSKRRIRPYKDDQSKFDHATEKIYWALWWHGTNRKGANWYKLRPAGKGRFDYVREALSNTNYLTTVLKNSAFKAVALFVDYFKTSAGNDITKFSQRGGRYVDGGGRR